MATILCAPAFELARVTDAGATSADTVLINPASASRTAVGLMVAYPGEPGEATAPVRLRAVPDAPPNVIVAHERLLTRLGLGHSGSASWELRLGNLQHVMAEKLTLELMSGASLDASAEEVAKDASLDGMLIAVQNGQIAGARQIEAGGVPARIREVWPRVDGEAIYELSARQTTLTLLASAQRSGVDICILADCSGSMSYNDLTISAEAPPVTTFFSSVFGKRPENRTQTRSDALVQALLDLLDRRLLGVGTVSRIALIAFGNASELRFPRASEARGMVEIDETTPSDVRTQFRQAIKDLLPQKTWGTDIGQALQFAATHLSNFGRPGNERLIVLISDGAHWQSKGSETKGELLENALTEPVSLMEILHDRMQIHLHAVGISNAQIFERWVRSDPLKSPQAYLVPAAIPNHALLEALVRVGGGDPARTGDTAVLEEYLRQLGEGVTRSVRMTPRGTQAERPLSANERAILARYQAVPTDGYDQLSSELGKLRDDIVRQYEKCNHFARALNGGHSLFSATLEATTPLFERTLRKPVRDKHDFRSLIIELYEVIDSTLPLTIRKRDIPLDWPDPFPAIKSLVHAGEFERLGDLRNPEAHHAGRRDTATRMAAAMRFFIGRAAIEPDDTAAWQALQLAVLKFSLRTLTTFGQMLDDASRAPRAAPQTIEEETPIIQW